MNETQTNNTGAVTAILPNISVKVHPTKDTGKLLAFASVNLGGVFAVNNIRIYDSKKGLFVAMPSSKGKDGQYYDLYYPTTKEMREALHSAVLGEYQKAVERPSVRDALQDATRKAAARPTQARTADKGAR